MTTPACWMRSSGYSNFAPTAPTSGRAANSTMAVSQPGSSTVVSSFRNRSRGASLVLAAALFMTEKLNGRLLQSKILALWPSTDHSRTKSSSLPSCELSMTVRL